jgi:hypothetical protein
LEIEISEDEDNCGRSITRQSVADSTGEAENDRVRTEKDGSPEIIQHAIVSIVLDFFILASSDRSSVIRVVGYDTQLASTPPRKLLNLERTSNRA